MSCERALFYPQICEQCRAGQVWQNTSEVKEVRGRRRRSVKWNRSAASPLFPPPPATSWFFLHSKRACQRHWSLLLVSAPSCCLLSLFAIGVAAFLLHAWRYRSSYSRVLFIPSAFDVIWQSLALVFPSSGGGPIFFFFSSILSCTQWARRRFTLCTKASWIVCASACQWVSLCASNRGLDLKLGSAHLWSGRSTTCSCAHAEASDINNSCRMWMEIEPWRLQIGSDVTSY